MKFHNSFTINDETRIDATLDIICERIPATVLYIGYAWFAPSMAMPVARYLLECMVTAIYLSLAFLGWPVPTPTIFISSTKGCGNGIGRSLAGQSTLRSLPS